MRRTALLLAAGVAALLAVASPALARDLPALQPAPADGLTVALRTGELTEAEYALQRALALFSRDEVSRLFGWVAPPGPRSATLTLRDLALRLDDLEPEDRARAVRLLDRPTLARPDNPASQNDPVYYDAGAITAGNYVFSCTRFCVSWVLSGRDAPTPADGDGNGRSDYIDAVFAVMETVWSTEISGLGYRQPKSDASSPDPLAINGQLDIYVMDLVGKTGGILGYCTTDDPNILSPASTYPGHDASAYCVLDDDYLEYGADWLTGLTATAAHEFFHAVQFAYNIDQDSWLLEATATWVEDEVFDDVNDNYGYVSASQVVRPSVPLDIFSPDDRSLQLTPYGTYTFFQLLTDRHGTGLVRDVIEAGDGVPGAPANHSLVAIPQALDQNKLAFASFFNSYAVANWWPPAFYEEGANWFTRDAFGNPVQLAVPFPTPFVLTARKRQSPARALVLDHLTSGYATFKPGAGVAPGAKLRVEVDASQGGSGARASIVTEARNGALRVIPIRLRNGSGSALVRRFGKLRYVALVVSNGSTRTASCYTDTAYPVFGCYGVPQEDDRVVLHRARLR